MKSLGLLFLLAVLANPAGLSAQDTTKQGSRIRQSPDRISRQEIEARAPDAQNAYEVVTRLRPLWLRTPGQGPNIQGATDVVVYVNEVRRGGPATLRELNRLEVAEIRHLRGIDASVRFGLGHEYGAILVKLK